MRSDFFEFIKTDLGVRVNINRVENEIKVVEVIKKYKEKVEFSRTERIFLGILACAVSQSILKYIFDDLTALDDWNKLAAHGFEAFQYVFQT